MNAKIVLALLSTGLLATPALSHEHEPVLGDWNTVMETPMGDFAANISVGASEDGYVVDIEDVPPAGGQAMPPMESTISDVAVDGATVTFLRSLETPQGPMDLTYTLTADGDTLAGEANSSFGPIPVTGTRAEEADEAAEAEAEAAEEG